MRILLVQHAKENNQSYPLGLAYVGAVALQNGHKIDFIDAALSKATDFSQEVIEHISQFDPHVIGMTVMTPQFTEAKLLIERIRSLFRGYVVVGGAHPSACSEETLRSGLADIVVTAEGEVTVPLLFNALENKISLESVPGIAYLNANGRYYQTDIPQVKNLDDIPYPPWHIFRPDLYSWRMRGEKIANIMTSRGCPYRCVYCYRGPTGGKYRRRSIENVMGEIRELNRNYGIRAFGIKDDMFTMDRQFVVDFCNVIKKEKLDIIWHCQTRADHIDKFLLGEMKKAGCIQVDFGVESGSLYILKKIRKKIDLNKVREAFKACHEVGVFSMAYYILGTPWETEETVKETIAFAKVIRASRSVFFLATPYPGTELSEAFKSAGWPLPFDYSDYRQYVEQNQFQSSQQISSNPNLAFLPICNHATREVLLSQLKDFRQWPFLFREYSNRYTIKELVAIVIPRILKLIK